MRWYSTSLEARRGRSQIRKPRLEGTEATMAALNHLIIPAKDKDASAKFLAGKVLPGMGALARR